MGSILLSGSSIVAAFSVDPEGEFLYANAAFLRILGADKISSLPDRNFRNEVLADSADWKYWIRARDGRPVPIGSLVLKTVDDREVVLKGDVWALPGNATETRQFFGAFVDISHWQSVERSLQHTARSEAMASLAGGMIHDFKNLLTVLVGNLYLVAEGVRDDPTLFDQAKRARDVAKRGEDLTRQLLALTRPESFEPQELDLGRVVSRLKPLLQHSLGSRIRLELEIAPDTSAVRASAGLLEGVIVNLVINARDAIAKSGTITVSTGNAAADADAYLLDSGPASFVCLSVEDDGAGIPEALQARIFEPFFSTKTKAGGTGLGLSMVRHFVESLGGTVQLQSKEGQGTKITLSLPASAGTPADSAVLTMPLKSLPAGNEQLLIVAGEPALAKTLEDCLSVLGYSIRVSSEPAEIARLATASQFQLVIIDSSASRNADVKPLAKAIRFAAPGSALLMITSAEHETHIDTGIEVLRKPFSLKDLAIAVRAVLEGRHDD